MELIYENKIKSIIKSNFGFFCKVETRDEYYRLFSYEDTEQAVKKIPKIRSASWVYDCDDMADWILAHLRNISPGIACFYIKALSRDKSEAHAWIGVINRDETISHIYEENHVAQISPPSDKYGCGILLRYPKVKLVRF